MPMNLDRALPYLAPTYSAEDTAPIRIAGSNDAPVSRVFSNTLVVHYMIDEPGVRVMIRERDVDVLGQCALHDRAVANLRAHTSRRKLRFDRGKSGAMLVVKLDGEHDA